MTKTAPRTRMMRKAATAAAAPVRAVKLADEGIVVAIVAVTGVVDAVNDLIVPGAFTASLRIRNPKVVDDHEWQRKVGRVLHVEEWLPGDSRLPARTKEGRPWPKAAGALVATMQYNLNTVRGRESFAEVKFYAESNEAEFSIGYKVPDGKARKRADGVRVILAVNLFEFSHVLFGAAPLSMALEVKSLHGGSAGTVTAPALAPAKRVEHPADEDEKPFPKAPAVDTTRPWDEDEKPKASMEAKTAADVLLQAKSLTASVSPTATKGQTALAAVLEAKGLDIPDPEVKAMSNMKGSYEERRNLIEAAARDLFDATYERPCVCVVATYDTEAVLTVYVENEDHSFVVPYTYTDEGIELGEPSPVELSLVAEPERGSQPSVEDAAIEDPETVEEVTVIAPVMASLAHAALLAGTESKAAEQLRAHIGEVFGPLLGKSADDEDPLAEVADDTELSALPAGDITTDEPTDAPAEEPADTEPDADADDTADEDVITKDNLPDGDWAMFRKTQPIEAVRMEGPFKVQTREGVLSCQDGWLALDSSGEPYPIDAEEMAAVYEKTDSATPVDEPAGGDVETKSARPDDDEAAAEAPAETDPESDDERVTLDPDEHFNTLDELEDPEAEPAL